MLTPDLHVTTNSTAEASPGQKQGGEPHLEFDASAGAISGKAPGSIFVHVIGEGGRNGGFLGLSLGEGEEKGVGKYGGAVDNGGIDAAITGGQDVGVADGEDNVPLGGKMGGGEVEGGDGGGGNGEFGEERVEG